MSGIANSLLIGAALANIVIGTLVLSRNKRLLLNRYFFFLSVAVAGWSSTNVLFQIIGSDFKFAAALLSYAFAGFLGVFFFLFAKTLTGKTTTVFTKTVVGVGVAGTLLAVIPGVVAIGVDQSGSIQTNIVPLSIYGVSLLVTLTAGIALLLTTFRRLRSQERGKVLLVLSGLSAAAGVGLFCNLFLPMMGNYHLVAVGPSGSLIFVSATAYAIVRHQLFDIRAFVLRSAVYLSSLMIIACIMFVPAILLLGLVVGVQFTWPTFILSLCTALFLAILYGALKTLFDRLTNRVFLRGYYDVQTVLNQLSDALVRRASVADLKTDSAKILRQPLKTKTFTYHLISDTPTATFASLQDQFSSHKNLTVINADPEFTKSSKDSPVLLVRLRTTHGDLGFITIGHKESGEAYTETDRRLLAIAADEIAISLQNALRLEEIQGFNATLQARVNEATQKLRQSNTKLQGLDQTKDEFITMASHQLRTPLTSVKGYLSMVLEGDVGPLNDQQKQLLTQSYVSAQRMVYLISDLLNLSRLNTGKFIIEPTPVDLREVIHSEMDQLRETALSREVNLQFNPPEPFPKILLDETKIHQVVMNLIDNAIYYTPPGGNIRVDLRETAHALEFRVIDTGIGVPKAEQRKLFSKFYRAQNAQAARPDGTGIGLFMAKKVVVAQGGAVIFESEEGKGSTFGFRFNKHGHAAPTQAIEA